MLGGSLGCNDGTELGSNEGIKFELSGGKLLVTMHGLVYGITLGFDVRTYLGSLDGYFDGTNYGKPEGLFNYGSLGFTDGKVLGTGEGIILVSTDGKVLGTIVRNVHGITLGIDVRTELGWFLCWKY